LLNDKLKRHQLIVYWRAVAHEIEDSQGVANDNKRSQNLSETGTSLILKIGIGTDLGGCIIAWVGNIVPAEQLSDKLSVYNSVQLGAREKPLSWALIVVQESGVDPRPHVV
jgi:hypothetical protein